MNSTTTNSAIKKFSLLVLSVIGFSIAPPSYAQVTFVTPSGSSGSDGPLSAQAVFNVSGDVLSIQLSNLEQNPTSAGQLVSSIEFTINGGSNPTLDSAQGVTATIAPGGAYTPSMGMQNLPKWGLDGSSGSFIDLSSFAFVPPPPEAPYDMIIGPDNMGGFSGSPGLYNNANPSITNPNHEPVVLGTAYFSLTIQGLSSLSQLSGVTFNFGTGPDTFIPGQPGNPVPEPTTIISGALMLIPLSIQLIRKMRQPKQEA